MTSKLESEIWSRNTGQRIYCFVMELYSNCHKVIVKLAKFWALSLQQALV